MQQFTPSRLVAARRLRGHTKRALAACTGISYRSLIAYEQGETEPSDAHLATLSEVLGVPRAFLYKSDLDLLQPEGVSFRALSKMTAGQREQALANGALALELSDWIESQFALPTPDVPDLRHMDSPEAAAMALRVRWRLGDKPIAHLIRLLEAKGVRIFSQHVQAREVDAFSFWRDARPFVVLNLEKSAERTRFDASHELAHLVLHQHGEPSGREAEREADAFASAFLMPRSSIVAHVPPMPSLDRLLAAKRHWGVSLAALAHRAHAVGLLSEWHYRSIAIDIQARGFRNAEPQPMPREMSQVMEKVFGALRAEGRSRAAVARELGWSGQDLDTLVFGLVVTAHGADSRAPTGGSADWPGDERRPAGPLRLELLP